MLPSSHNIITRQGQLTNLAGDVLNVYRHDLQPRKPVPYEPRSILEGQRPGSRRLPGWDSVTAPSCNKIRYLSPNCHGPGWDGALMRGGVGEGRFARFSVALRSRFGCLLLPLLSLFVNNHNHNHAATTTTDNNNPEILS